MPYLDQMRDTLKPVVAPCTGCDHVKRCARSGEMCQSFHEFLLGRSIARWSAAPREPSVATAVIVALQAKRDEHVAAKRKKTEERNHKKRVGICRNRKRDRHGRLLDASGAPLQTPPCRQDPVTGRFVGVPRKDRATPAEEMIPQRRASRSP